MLDILFSTGTDFLLILSGPLIGIIAFLVIYWIDKPKKKEKKNLTKL